MLGFRLPLIIIKSKFFWIFILFLFLIGYCSGGSKKETFDFLDPKNKFYYDDNKRVMTQAVWLKCSPKAMGKSTWLPYRTEAVRKTEPSIGENINILGPTVRVCFYSN